MFKSLNFTTLRMNVLESKILNLKIQLKEAQDKIGQVESDPETAIKTIVSLFEERSKKIQTKILELKQLVNEITSRESRPIFGDPYRKKSARTEIEQLTKLNFQVEKELMGILQAPHHFVQNEQAKLRKIITELNDSIQSCSSELDSIKNQEEKCTSK